MYETTNNYLKQVEAVRADFLKWDQSKIIKRFNLEHDDGYMYIDLFGQKHKINRQTAEVSSCVDGSAAGFNAVLSIYDILCNSKDNAKLSGEWQTLRNLSPHSNFGGSDKDLFGPTALKLSGKTNELKTACERLGGISSTKADVGFRFEAFPFLPMVFQFWDGDDEFPPRINFLFDSNTLDFIHFETAWYVAGYFIDLIEETACNCVTR